MPSLMYTKYAEEYDTAIQNNIYNANLDRPSTIALLPEIKNKRLLDLGCGPGVYIDYFISQKAKVTAIDSSSEMVNIVKEKFGESVTVYAQDLAMGVPKENSNEYDVVVSALMIHYIEDLEPLFKDVCRVLKKEGEFIFSTDHPMVSFKSSPSSNYFKKEKIVESWYTLGRPVEVMYYRQPLSLLFKTIQDAGLYVVTLTEGQPAKDMQELSPKHYEKLSKEPNFMFIKCKKI